FYIVLISLFFFFFSSRRRHTRSDRDWSSDVCSSDLARSARGLWPCAEAPGDLLLFSASVGGFRVQAPESVSPLDGAQGRPGSGRPEERRVGKECRCRGWR